MEVSPTAPACLLGFSAVENKAMKFSVSIIALLLCISGYVLAQSPVGAQTSSTSAPVKQTGGDDERYRIGYQDTLDIQVFNHPNLSRRSTVNPDGTINLFRLSEPIMAVCKTELELANDIAKAYEKDYLRNPEVSVTAVEQRSQAVHIIGAVKTPGSFYLKRRTQLLELLANAGGPDVDKAGSQVAVFRPGSTSNCKMPAADATADAGNVELLYFKLRDVQEGKSTLWMQPGDVVSVMDADQVYVYGNVNKQGVVRMREPITLTQAIASAEGLKPATDMDNVRVIRQKPGSTERTETVYNFKDIAKGRAADPYLEPNDIVAVSQDKVQGILNSIGRSVTNGIPSIFYRIP
jgi:polysaccharide export outer membrane protein